MPSVGMRINIFGKKQVETTSTKDNLDLNDSGGASVMRDRTPLHNTLGVNDLTSNNSSMRRTSKCKFSSYLILSQGHHRAEEP